MGSHKPNKHDPGGESARAGRRVHFAFGEDDTYVLCEMPDHPTAASVAIAIEAAGGLRVQVVPVLTPAEVDEATHRVTTYSPPGT
ncbi:GYD domain-containing protein [Micromonospora sp. KC606]|uniref:GYD domain-containing protein n=1 Tax=Micromonospora sp. KC606 TaxID=2530379 RepID=UPI00104955CA|nr:GYD domain-containing protein [Micromonospora sp. KC606]TDC81824.1 GYD domain-containing protein [Micromonospora sp. KC606]